MSNRRRKTDELLSTSSELPEPLNMDSPSGFQPAGDGAVVRCDGASVARPKSTFERLKQVPRDPVAWMDMFNHLVRVHFPREFGDDLNYMEREDIAREAMDKLMEKIDSADGIGYVYTIANREAFKRLRKNRIFECLSEDEEVADDDERPLKNVSEKARQVREQHHAESNLSNQLGSRKEALASLPFADRTMITAYAEFKEANPESQNVSRDFGLLHGMTDVNVRKKVSRIRKRLRDIVNKWRHDAA